MDFESRPLSASTSPVNAGCGSSNSPSSPGFSAYSVRRCCWPSMVFDAPSTCSKAIQCRELGRQASLNACNPSETGGSRSKTPKRGRSAPTDFRVGHAGSWADPNPVETAGRATCSARQIASIVLVAISTCRPRWQLSYLSPILRVSKCSVVRFSFNWLSASSFSERPSGGCCRPWARMTARMRP